VSTPAPSITGGTLSWDETVTTALPGWTCLWQDLDGLHVAAPPTTAPPTSILWAWADDGTMARLRLDGDTAHVAICPADTPGVIVQPWTDTDGRVRAARFAADTTTRLDLSLEQVIVDGADSHAGPVTFLRPARP
jgi:hypothetical protein